jgi:Domain of unknown function (DUF4389)
MASRGRVTFDVTQPDHFGRSGVPLRFVILILFFLPGSINWLASLVYLPVTTAVLVREKGAERFLAEDARRVTDLLRWIIGIYAYFVFLTDHFSLDAEEDPVEFGVECAGTPSVGSALGRMLKSLPSIVAFAVVGIGALGVWLLANLIVLATGNYPRPLYGYQRGVNRWQARLFAYHTSLVDTYPPFRLDTGRELGEPISRGRRAPR